jgi:hypothetical protein
MYTPFVAAPKGRNAMLSAPTARRRDDDELLGLSGDDWASTRTQLGKCLVTGGPSRLQRPTDPGSDKRSRLRCHDTRGAVVSDLAKMPASFPAWHHSPAQVPCIRPVPETAPPLRTRRPLSRHRSGYLRPGCRIAARGTSYPGYSVPRGWDPQHPCHFIAGRSLETRSTPLPGPWVWVGDRDNGIDRGAGAKVPRPLRRHVGSKQASPPGGRRNWLRNI